MWNLSGWVRRGLGPLRPQRPWSLQLVMAAMMTDTEACHHTAAGRAVGLSAWYHAALRIRQQTHVPAATNLVEYHS